MLYFSVFPFLLRNYSFWRIQAPALSAVRQPAQRHPTFLNRNKMTRIFLKISLILLHCSLINLLENHHRSILAPAL